MLDVELLKPPVIVFIQTHEFVTPTKLLKAFDEANYTKEAIATIGPAVTELIKSGQVKLTVDWSDIPTFYLSST